MEISKKLQDFLNDNDMLNLIADEDWRELFSNIKGEMKYETDGLHKLLVKSGIASTDQILKSLNYVPSWFCSGFDDLTSITIPDGARSIGDYAFYDCHKLTSITIPNSVTSIGYGAFYSCKKLTDITLPTSLTSIGESAFEDCTSLTSITIPDKVTSIGERTFFGCVSLTSITIPGSVTSIDEDAFWGCDLKTIYFNGTKDQWKQVKKTRGWKGSNTQVKIIFKG